MTDIVPALKAEIAELKADLNAKPDPRVRKLQRLEATLAEYEPSPAKPQPNGNGSLPAANPHLAAVSKAVKMKLHIGMMLKDNGPLHRKDLLASLLAAGIMGKETKPMQALAIFLSSRKDLFESDGSGNFSLRQGAELTPQ